MLGKVFQVSRSPSSGLRSKLFSCTAKERKACDLAGRRSVEYSLCRSFSLPCPGAKNFVDFSMVACLKSFTGPLPNVAAVGTDHASEQAEARGGRGCTS